MRRGHKGRQPRWAPVLKQTLTPLIADAIERRVFPGAVVGVQYGNQRTRFVWGTTRYGDPGSQPVDLATIYDIASLTKVVTATAVLRLRDQGRIELDAPVQAYLPQFTDSSVKIFHLLTHTSGLNLRLSTLAPHGGEALRHAIYTTRPSSPPGTVVAYTNINSVLLGDTVSSICRSTLAQAFERLVFEPVRMPETTFNPEQALTPRVAPTEHDLSWRHTLLHGVVHDESAHALGGVAGHAGLFSTCDDLLMLGSAWLDAWHGRRDDFLKQETARTATMRQTPAGLLGCGYGWMLERTNFMGTAPADTFGHTGFTGPAIVVTPSRSVVVVILSNRVYPQRAQPIHHAVTAEVVDRVLQAIPNPETDARYQ